MFIYYFFEDKGKDILFSVTFEGALRAWSLEDMLRTRDTLPLRIILQDIHEAKYLEISRFNSELMMVLTTQDCLVCTHLDFARELKKSAHLEYSAPASPFFFESKLFSSGDFTKLLAIPCPEGSRWVGGSFIDQNLLLLWSTVCASLSLGVFLSAQRLN